MKQAEDTSTADIFTETKRQRGRPAKADALTGAERAKMFRERQKAAGIKIVRLPQSVLDDAAKEQRETERVERHRAFSLESAYAEIRRLVEKIAQQDAEIKDLKLALHRRKK